MAKRHNKPQPKGIGFFHMLRDVLVASINKGQFPWAILAMIVISIIWKMPPQDVSEFAFRVLDSLERRVILGYAIACVLAVGWFLHSRYQRRIITGELNRVSTQRNQLQEQTLGNRIRSSEGRS